LDENEGSIAAPTIALTSYVQDANKLEFETQKPKTTAFHFSDPLEPFPTDQSHEIPILPELAESSQVHSSGERVSVTVRDTPLHDVLALIAQQQGLSIVAPHELNSNITITLQPTTLENALNAIMAVSGCVYTRINDVIYVTAVAKEGNENFQVQGRMVWVFDLNYIAAEDAEKVITGLLSPVGKVFSRTVDNKNNRRAVEQIVVEDLPPFIRRIEGYLLHADQPPRQVMVEARVLQIKLGRDDKHGINFESIGNVDGTRVILGTQLLATGEMPGAVFTIEGSRFNNLVDCLVTTTDSKTLASPKLLMINGQESRIQIGRRIGFSTSTTTQTVTVENVQFLDVGVVLNVTPQITADGNIMMRVNPKVSTGEISPVNNLPQEETTELETTIMVADGDGVIIGGLIQESDVKRQSKLPFLGDIWLVGRLFQRNTVTRERSEVVVALLPRIVTPNIYCSPEELSELQRSYTPVLTPELKSAKRPEPTLRDAIDNPSWPRRARSRR
jgi:type II secretory pathway component HofQ